jgi:hypothetical protein
MPTCPSCGHDNGKHRRTCGHCQSPLGGGEATGRAALLAARADAVYCRDCGTVAPPKKHTPGHFLIEVVLWLCFLVPGIIYSIWRLSARRKACAECGGLAVIPRQSPAAKAALGQ